MRRPPVSRCPESWLVAGVWSGVPPRSGNGDAGLDDAGVGSDRDRAAAGPVTMKRGVVTDETIREGDDTVSLGEVRTPEVVPPKSVLGSAGSNVMGSPVSISRAPTGPRSRYWPGGRRSHPSRSTTPYRNLAIFSAARRTSRKIRPSFALGRVMTARTASAPAWVSRT